MLILLFCLKPNIFLSLPISRKHQNVCDMKKQNTAEGRATVGKKCYFCLLGKTSAEDSCTVSMHRKTNEFCRCNYFPKQLLRTTKQNSEKIT